MLTEAPTGFAIDAFYKGIYIFQAWEIFPGHLTVGPKNVALVLDNLGLERDLTGKRVLDIAPWNGFFTFECARRGAEVVALGPEDPYQTGFAQTRDLLGASKVTYERGSVYSLSPERFGMFDIVLFLGLLYHLRHPLLALDRIHDVTADRMFADTPVIDRVVYDQTLDESEKAALLEASAATNRVPMAYFTTGAETGDAYNWFVPNTAAFHAFVESSGFSLVHRGGDGGWEWVCARRTQRTFTVGLEGYNPGSSRTEA